MSEISKIELSGEVYDIKDETARNNIDSLNDDLTNTESLSISANEDCEITFSGWSCNARKRAGIVTLDFNCSTTQTLSTGAVTLFTLETGWRPAVGIMHTYCNQTGSTFFILQITTGGVVSINPQSGTSGAWMIRQHLAFIARD